ncbi:MAG: cytochrome c [Candidatus Kapabacteria bacterium]|nr:cytochrome c [Candidatus Kapabacteria bacterium]
MISFSFKKFKMNKYFHFILPLLFVFFIQSCGDKEEFFVVKNIQVGPLNPEMAAKGKVIFQSKCASCHKMESKYVGPPLGMVTKRRSADFVMSQIIDPEAMIKNNDTIKALYAQYNTPMANQHLTQAEARSVFEYLRQVADNGGK